MKNVFDSGENMEIKATCSLDLKAMQALTHLWLYKKADPKKRMIFWTVVYAFLTAVIIGKYFCLVQMLLF